MLNRNVTGDELRVQHYQPESTRASMQWQLPSSPLTKKFKVTPSTVKVMLTVFWDTQGLLLVYFQKRSENVNSTSYREVLLKLWDVIRRKCSGQVPRSVLLHHDNARPHTARATQERIQEPQWELLELGP
jgi:histone-lysine N-methyltransferase SETMAR